MNVLSLFDGISCGQVALAQAEIKVDNYFASEIDKYAIQVTQKNYPNTVQLGDIAHWRDWHLPKIDLIMGGSPCQGFSFAGKRLNFEDPRSKLFFTFVDIVKYHKPKYFLLENVKMKKEYQEIITDHMGVEPIEINSSLVSAQNRKRLYWTNIPDITQPKDSNILLKDILENDVEPVTFTETRTEEAKRIRREYQKKYNKDFSPRRSKELKVRTDNKSNCITATLSNKEHLVVLKCKEHKVVYTTNYVQYDLRGSGYKSQDQRAFYLDGKHGCLSNSRPETKTGILISTDKNQNICKVRQLTPVECERLQTLPDNYTASIPKSQRYKAIGNGWTVDIITHIFKNMETR